jgi:myosin heavy subunit
MTKLQQLLVGAAVIGSAAAFFLGIAVNSKKNFLTKQVGDIERILADESLVEFTPGRDNPPDAVIKTAKMIKSASLELAQTKETLKNVQDELGAQTAKTQTLTTDLNTSSNALNDVKSKLDATRSELDASKSKLDELQGIFKQRNPQELVKALSDREEEIKILNGEKRIVQDSLASCTTNLDALLEKDKLRKERGLAGAKKSGRVLAVNRNWNFVVLDIGTDVSLGEGIDLTVYRGKDLVGKLRTVSVEKDTSIADVIPEWTEGEIQIGDQVLF